MKLGIVAAAVCLMVAISAFPMAPSGEFDCASGSYSADDAGYYFSGDIMSSLSDSVGISDSNYKVGWKLTDTMGYAISGDYAYAFTKDGKLNKVSLDDGNVVKSVATGAELTVWPAVNGRLVLDPQSGNVYDLDLNQKYKIDATSTQAYYDDGFWYVVQNDKTCKCFSVTDEDPSSATNVQAAKWSSTLVFYADSFTLPVSLAFGDKALYYPGIGQEDSTKRILYSIDKATGVQLDSFEMTEVASTYWNSGFISYADGTIYVSTHWDNMFGPIGDGTKPVFVKVPVKSDGTFDASSAKYICNGVDNSYSSKMVKVGDLGFAMTGRSFMVFDLKNDDKIIAKTDVDSRLCKTYSNIAIAYGSYDLVYGYVSPAGIPSGFASPMDGLICFEYKISTNEIRTFDLEVGRDETNTTYSIKIGPDGDVLFEKSNSTLYCITQAVKTYTVRFDSNGGSGNMADDTGISGTYALPACTFTAPLGKAFDAWSLSASGPAISGTTINVESDVTLYALWRDAPAETYTVGFNANGGSGSMPDATVAAGKYTLPACTFTAPDGKKFQDWAYSPTGPAITGYSIDVSSDIVLYALWEDIPASTYTVRFDANGGSGSMPDVSGVSGRYALPECKFTAPSAKAFDAWSLSASGPAISGTSIDVASDVTLYALWKDAPTFTVTFNANGGTGRMSEAKVLQGDYTLPNCAFGAPTGKEFDAWSLTPGEPAISGATIYVSSDITLYALWRAETIPTYTVSFDTAGGSGIASMTVAQGTEMDRPRDPTFVGFVCHKWEIQGAEVAWPYTVKSDVTMTAVWGIDVTNGNGATVKVGQDLVVDIVRGDVESIQYIDIDNKITKIPKDCYQMPSTHSVKILGKYTETLRTGSYELQIITDDGIAYSDFYIEPKSTGGGDGTSTAIICGVVLLAAVIVASVIGIMKLRR